MKKLSIITPVYNEEKTVGELLKRLFAVKLPVDQVEYIIVDDFSIDKTTEKIKEAVSRTNLKSIKIYHHKKNLGKGAAIRTGLENATGDYIIIQDADLEYNPKDIAKLIPKVSEKYKVVYGTRLNRLPNFKEDVETFYLIHYLGNRFLSLITSILYYHWITDMENCYKLFPKDALRNFTLQAKGFEFEPEITAKLLKSGYKIAEVPITTTPRGYDEGKKIYALRDGSKAVWTLLKYRFTPINKERSFKPDNFFWAEIGILFISVFLRFINYNNRIILAYDQTHDALLAQYAVLSHHLPLLGPFSSAGPFQTGGEWYWILMAGTIIFSNSFMGPWIFMTVLSTVFVYFSIIVAREINGKNFAIIAGLFASISNAQIAQSTNLTNQTPLALISLFGIWCAVKYLKNASGWSIFSLGICIGLASSIHLSGVALICLAISLIIVKRKVQFFHVGLFVLGIFIPWIPVFFIDAQNNFINTKHMIQYYLHDQYKIPLEALGRRWLTYLSVFWPTQWANIIGAFSIIGYIELLFLLITLVVYRKYLKKDVIMLGISVILMIIILRYTHTPIFDSYLIFMHPFVLFLMTWVVYILIEKRKAAGLFLLFIIVVNTLYRDFETVILPPNGNALLVKSEINTLNEKFKREKFAVFDNNQTWKDKNYILSLYLSSMNAYDPQGLKISIVVATRAGEFNAPVVYGSTKGYQLLNLSNYSNSALFDRGWKLVDGECIYKDTEEWFKN